MKSKDQGELDVEAVTRETYNRIAAAYSSHAHAAPFREWIASSLARFADLLPDGSRILVPGCGDGKDAEWLATSGYDCVLLDYSAPMLDLARHRVPAAATVLADLRQLPFARRSFDGVWASACLYHVRKASMSEVMEGISDVLRPGGFFYLNLRAGAGEKLDCAPRSYPQGGARFYALYSEEEILRLVRHFAICHRLAVDESVGRDYFQFWLQKP